MSSFIDRWLNRMSSNQSHNSLPTNMGHTASYQTVQAKPTGDSQVYFKKRVQVASSPNNTNIPVSYFEEEAIVPKDEFNKMLEKDRMMGRKTSVSSIESE